MLDREVAILKQIRLRIGRYDISRRLGHLTAVSELTRKRYGDLGWILLAAHPSLMCCDDVPGSGRVKYPMTHQGKSPEYFVVRNSRTLRLQFAERWMNRRRNSEPKISLFVPYGDCCLIFLERRYGLIDETC